MYKHVYVHIYLYINLCHQLLDQYTSEHPRVQAEPSNEHVMRVWQALDVVGTSVVADVRCVCE